jgi:hypothetical protein
MQAVNIYSEPEEVGARLQALGLREDVLVDSVRSGLNWMFSCTLNDVPNFAGYAMWDKIIRFLREDLLPQGWERNNSRNYATTVHPEGLCTLAVAAGNAATGRPDREPSTRTAKGPVTREHIARNNGQLDFGEVYDAFPAPKKQYFDGGPTYLLLHYWDEETETVWVELSMPSEMTAEGLVTRWAERIVLGAYHVDPGMAVDPATPQPDDIINIDVDRLAG